MAYVTRKEHVLVNGKLFIPQEWNDDPARCEKAHVPKNEYEKHKTRHQHCLEMLDHQGEFLPHDWITGDDELGRSAWFRRELRKRNEKYVLAVPSNTNVRDLENVPEYKGRGAVPQGEFRTLADWKDFVTEDEWHVEDVRDGPLPGGRTVLPHHCINPLPLGAGVEEPTNGRRHFEAEGNCGEAASFPETNGIKYDYYLSNAPYGTTMAEFARVILGSHRVEDCFRRAKDECGLAEYEVQSWTGWHHHMALSLLAAFFLTKETLRSKKRVRR